MTSTLLIHRLSYLEIIFLAWTVQVDSDEEAASCAEGSCIGSALDEQDTEMGSGNHVQWEDGKPSVSDTCMHELKAPPSHRTREIQLKTRANGKESISHEPALAFHLRIMNRMGHPDRRMDEVL